MTRAAPNLLTAASDEELDRLEARARKAAARGAAILGPLSLAAIAVERMRRRCYPPRPSAERE
jgi:spore germination cell wall hydrolase CwlJ-like protein